MCRAHDMMGGKEQQQQNNDKTKSSNKPRQLLQEAQLRAHHQRNSGMEDDQNGRENSTCGEDRCGPNCEDSVQCTHNSGNHLTAPQHSNDASSRLVASTSSPSLLQGCSDSTTHAGAGVEKHVHSHKVDVNVVPHTPVSPGTQPQFNQTYLEPPDSVFLTPSTQRTRHSSHRPNSAPADQLERISGTLLRLVGDNYLCTNCGRQLRTIGDQMTLEADIRRTFSAGQLNQLHYESDDD